MRSLTYFIGATIDGFVAAPDGGTDALSVPPEFVQFLCTEYPETLPSPARSALQIEGAPHRHFDTVVMGRSTFVPALEAGLASAYPHLEQHVVSTTIDPADHDEVTVHGGDPLDLVRSLKRREGLDIWLAGGPTLATSVFAELDRIIVKTYPVVMGDGRPLFSSPTTDRAVVLEWSADLPGGVVVSSYAVGGTAGGQR